MKKIILISIFIFIPLLLLLFFSFSVEAGGPAKIAMRLFTIYEIGASHTPGLNRTAGSQSCQVTSLSLCVVGTPCPCDAQFQEGYYYRIMFEIENQGATLDEMWGYYDSIEELNGLVASGNDIWVVDGGTDETCTSSTWATSTGTLTWVESDLGCTLALSEDEIGELGFIIKAGSGLAGTSDGRVYAEEDTDAGGNLSAYINITVASALTCSITPSTLSFGTLNTSSVSETTNTATTTITAPGAVRLDIYDWGDNINLDPGLWNSTSGPDTIVSPNAAEDATATLQSGVEGYGIIAATTTAGSGTLTTAQRYNSFYLSGFDPDAVGGLEWGTGSAVIIASSSAAVTDREIVVTHKAAISASTFIGDYKDTIIYTCALY